MLPLLVAGDVGDGVQNLLMEDGFNLLLETATPAVFLLE